MRVNSDFFSPVPAYCNHTSTICLAGTAYAFLGKDELSETKKKKKTQKKNVVKTPRNAGAGSNHKCDQDDDDVLDATQLRGKLHLQML